MRLTLEQGMRLLVIADIHLTNKNQDSNEKEWVRRLKRIFSLRKADALVILGDLWDFGVKPCPEKHRLFFDWLKKRRVFYVAGNNDWQLSPIKEILIESKDPKTCWPVLLKHGHQYNGLLAHFLTPLKTFLPKSYRRRPPRYSLRFSLSMFKLAERLKKKIVLAHTHISDEQGSYFNCGSFPESKSYILIDEKLRVRLYEKKR